MIGETPEIADPSLTDFGAYTKWDRISGWRWIADQKMWVCQLRKRGTTNKFEAVGVFDGKFRVFTERAR